MKKQFNYWFYDIECLPNFHSFYTINRDTKEEKCFIIHESQNDFKEYLVFLFSLIPTETTSTIMIGFNNINYDYPIIYYIMNTLNKFKELYNNPNQLTKLIRDESDRVINIKNKGGFSSIASWKVQIPQIDPYKIQHYDNKAKSCSLKYLEAVIRMNEIETFDDFNSLIKKEQIPQVIHYNRHDVLATEQFYYENVPDIKMRQQLSQEYGIDLMNADDPKLGTEIFAIPIANELGITIKELKQLRTKREYVDLGDCILPKINFKSEQFNKVLEWFKEQRVYTDKSKKKETEYKFHYKGVNYVYGVGGIHACIKSGRYIKSDTHKIVDIDVGSFYTALGIKNGFAPEHLGKAFSKPLEEKYNYRLSIKKDKSKASIAGGWKLALNGTYGMSKNEYSYFYDPTYTFKITINGQLFLTMLIDRILLAISDCQLLQANTDGITLLINRDKEKELLDICKRWESYTQLTLEYVNYKELCIRDVNNYLAVKDLPDDQLYKSFNDAHWYDNNYTLHKAKGAYQIIPERNGKIAYDANWDHRIVPKAAYDYLVKGIPIQETILNCKDIFDFCGIAKFASNYYSLYTYPDGKQQKLGKVVRYYVSSGGGKLEKVRKIKLKKDQKGSNSGSIEAGYSITLFNKKIEYDNFKDYRIDYSFYIREANKLINGIEKVEQLKLGLI